VSQTHQAPSSYLLTYLSHFGEKGAFEVGNKVENRVPTRRLRWLGTFPNLPLCSCGGLSS
jgi:hypothetical protein